MNQDKKKKQKSEFELAEYHIKRHFESVTDSITLFKDDCLCSKPGLYHLILLRIDDISRIDDILRIDKGSW